MFDKNIMLHRRQALGILAMSGMSLTSRTSSRRTDAEQEQAKVPLRTIGVLGGLGPQATMDFEARVHRVAQCLIPQRENSGYPPMVVYYHRHPPILLNDDLSPRFPIQPDPRLLDAAKRLGAWADFLVIASNAPHLIQKQIEQAAGRNVLSMIDVTIEAVQRRGWRNVGVLGFGHPMVYTTPLVKLKIAYETLDDARQTALDKEIMKVMEGRDTAQSPEIVREAVGSLRSRKVDGIILGCTELPLLLRTTPDADLIDPLELLAEATVKLAIAGAFKERTTC
jgi:aspartate racemase